MKPLLHVLHVEDSKDDCELIHNLLAKEGFNCDVKRVETRPEFFDAIQNDTFDLILADCKLPNFSGLHALEIAHALTPEVPFVFVSGTIGEETAIESLQNGATDYVLKDRLSRLVPAIRRAMTEAEEKTLNRQMQQRLREAGRLEAISTLSNGIAHDFNNILTIILGHASLLTQEHTKPERVLKITETITEAAQRASGIVEQLMAFARKSDGHLTSTNLNRYVRDHTNFLKASLPSGVELIFKLSDQLPEIMADASQLERILTNLLTNSVDSMGNSGTITISTHQINGTELPGLLPDYSGSSYVCLKITDTGAGMDSMTRDHVFEPFYTTKERGHATGLGLPVVYGLMQAQNGSVEVESEPGQGTAVSLFFPILKKSPVPTSIISQATDPSLQGSETLLLVEDESDVSFFLETILKSHGYHVLSAHDYDEALKLFQKNRDIIQLVFSDVGLPKVDGITLGTKLRTLKPSLRLILTSGYSPREFKSRMDELHPEAFLSKPYNTHHILQCVRTVLDGAKVLRSA